MPRPRLLAFLYAAGVLISAFTVLRGIDPFDEGLILSAAARVADGQLPYQDFPWPYGPAHPYLLAAASELFGESLLWWRIVRVACDAGVALLVFVLVHRAVGLKWGLAAWLCAACAMAQPVSANPFPPALLLGLAAFAVATAPGPPRRWWLWAGLLIGAASAWRLDFALYAGGAVAITALVRPPGDVGARALAVARFAGAAMAAGLLVYAPFLISSGPAEMYDELIGKSSSERDYWTLPFPFSYDGSFRLWPPGGLGEDAKDVLGFYVPLLSVIGFAVVAAGGALALRKMVRCSPEQRSGCAPPPGKGLWLVAGLLVFGAGTLLYLLSRTDEFHANPAIVVLAVALPLCAAGARPLGTPGGVVAGTAVAVFALLLTYGVANRASALVQPQPYETLALDVADGVKAGPSDARALPAVVKFVQGAVPPGEPIYAATARSDLVRFSNPLLYVLTDRPNVLDRDVGLFALPSAQREIVDALEREQPRAVVRWTDPISSRAEPNLRGEPSGSRLVDEYLRAEYRVGLKRGEYEVLVPRG